MLSILGILGVLVAGFAADAILSGKDIGGRDTDDDYGADDDLDRDAAGSGLPDDLAAVDQGREGNPVSDDLDDPTPEGMTIRGTDQGDILSGGNGNDLIHGQAGDDLIDGRDGDDWIDAGAGNDAVWAGAGNDTVFGGSGNDTVDGQAGDDLIYGGDGADALAGHSGDDTLYGGAGADTLLGGAGDDLLDGGAGDDWLAGGHGNDTLLGGAGSDVLDGGAGDDWLSGLDGDVDDFSEDFLNGGAGDDWLVLGSGDHGHGDAGADSFVLHDWLAEGGVAHVSDYSAAQDRLVVVYDPLVHPDPHLSLSISGDGSASTLYLDGRALVVIRGDAVNLRDVELKAA